MARPGLTRRDFIATSGSTIVGSLAFTTGPIALIAPTRTWAIQLESLSNHDGKTLLRLTRHLYPHETLEDAVYALVAKELDRESQSDKDTARLLIEGVAELDEAAGGTWLSQETEYQLRLLRARETTPFFQKVRSTAVVSLYNNDMAFAHFGYEGEAYSKGGYLGRGFNDLNWLPEPPITASPKI